MTQPSSGEALRRQGAEALRQGQWDAALEALTRCLALSSQDTGALVMLGIAYSELGRHDEAVQSLDRAVALAPGATAVQYNRGLVLERAGRREEAVHCFETALRLDPGNANARQHLEALRRLASPPVPPAGAPQAPPAGAPQGMSPPRLDAPASPSAAGYYPPVGAPVAAPASSPGAIPPVPPPPPPVPAAPLDVTGAQASNPGRIKVQLATYYRCFPKTLFWVAGLVGLGLFLVLAGPPRAWIIPLIGLVFFLLGLMRLSAHFSDGDVNPALVVSTSPYLIAVYGDLTTLPNGYWPVIKILPHPLGRMTGGPPPVGTRLATVAAYSPGSSPDHWGDFDPRVVNCATTDRAEIERVLASIPADQWARLEEGLRQVPRPLCPGLYPVQLAPPLPPQREQWR